MGDCAAYGPADGHYAHGGGVEGHYVWVASCEAIGPDHGQDSVAPDHAGDAHDEEDDESDLQTRRVCKCNASGGPYEAG